MSKSKITIEKSTLPQTDLEIEMNMSTISQTIIVNNNGIYYSVSDD